MRIDDFLPKRIALILLMVFLFGSLPFLLHYIKQNNQQDDDIQAEEDPEEVSAVFPASIKLGQSTLARQYDLGENELVVREVEPNDLIELQHGASMWEKSRGYFDKDDLLQYETYDYDALLSLADAGDLKAMHLLSDRLMAADEREGSDAALWTASIHGSTAALTELASREVSQFLELIETDAGYVEQLKKAMVYAELAAMRGDQFGVWSTLMRTEDKTSVLGLDDLEAISESAQEAFSFLDRERAQLGLGEFDNRIDPYRKVQFDLMLFKLSNPQGWATEYYEKPELVDAF